MTTMFVRQRHSLQLALQAAILAVAFAAAGHAEDKDARPFSAQDLQAKIEYCQRCHQPSAQGIRAASPIPDSQDNKSNTWRISCGPLLSTGECILSCITWCIT